MQIYHFRDKETEPQRKRRLPKKTKEMNHKARLELSFSTAVSRALNTSPSHSLHLGKTGR